MPPASLSDQAYDVVEEMIVTLQLPPGTVFSEAALSAQIEIGRTPLREALQRLAADRLVVVLPRRGMMVSDVNLVDFLALVETRRVLDQLVVARAAKRATPTQRATLAACQTAMQTAAIQNDLDGFMRADRAGDACLAAAARNPFAAAAVAPLHAHCRRFWYYHQHEGDLMHSATLHQTLLQAVMDGSETEAANHASLLIDYLEQFTRQILELA